MTDHEKTRILTRLYADRVEHSIFGMLWFMIFFIYDTDGSYYKIAFKVLIFGVCIIYYFLERKVRKILYELEQSD
jgi:hypothetical protein